MTTLAEAMILLSDRGSSGRFTTVDRNSATVGATLADLALAGRIALQGKDVTVVDPQPTGDAVMDEVLAQIAASKPRRPAKWMSRLYWGFPNRVRDALAGRGVLKRTTSKLFHVRKYTSATPAAETETRQRLLAAVATGGTDDAWVAELAAQVRAANMEQYLLPELPRAEARQRIAAIAASSWTGEASRAARHNNYIAYATALLPIAITLTIVFTR